jgi:hypothetical protein
MWLGMQRQGKICVGENVLTFYQPKMPCSPAVFHQAPAVFHQDLQWPWSACNMINEHCFKNLYISALWMFAFKDVTNLYAWRCYHASLCSETMHVWCLSSCALLLGQWWFFSIRTMQKFDISSAWWKSKRSTVSTLETYPGDIVCLFMHIFENIHVPERSTHSPNSVGLFRHHVFPLLNALNFPSAQTWQNKGGIIFINLVKAE